MEINKEIKERTKLGNKERIMLVLQSLATITAIMAMIMLKDITWGLVALLWADMALEDYCHYKIRKLDEMQQEVLWDIIKTQNEIINNLSECDDK